jgi:hypothetical protein
MHKTYWFFISYSKNFIIILLLFKNIFFSARFFVKKGFKILKLSCKSFFLSLIQRIENDLEFAT